MGKVRSDEVKADLIHEYVIDHMTTTIIHGTSIRPYLGDEHLLQLTVERHGYASLEKLKTLLEERKQENRKRGRGAWSGPYLTYDRSVKGIYC